MPKNFDFLEIENVLEMFCNFQSLTRLAHEFNYELFMQPPYSLDLSHNYYFSVITP